MLITIYYSKRYLIWLFHKKNLKEYVTYLMACLQICPEVGKAYFENPWAEKIKQMMDWKVIRTAF